MCAVPFLTTLSALKIAHLSHTILYSWHTGNHRGQEEGRWLGMNATHHRQNSDGAKRIGCKKGKVFAFLLLLTLPSVPVSHAGNYVFQHKVRLLSYSDVRQCV